MRGVGGSREIEREITVRQVPMADSSSSSYYSDSSEEEEAPKDNCLAC